MSSSSSGRSETLSVVVVRISIGFGRSVVRTVVFAVVDELTVGTFVSLSPSVVAEAVDAALVTAG